MYLWLLAIMLAATTAPWLVRLVGSHGGWILAIVPTCVFAAHLNHLTPVVGGEFVSTSLNWVPELNLSVSLRLDGLSLLFGLLISGIGSVVLVYAGAYLKGDDRLGRLLLLLLLFMGSMLGLVLADNLLTLFIFWELTSITSYLLIGFNNEDPVARSSALQALLVTGGGGLALLPGLILLGVAGQSFEISALLVQAETVRQHGFYLPALLLILVGAFTKSAQFPFHFWLPDAMAAPTPISAYLHSATMVTAGVYLLARLHPILGGTPEWFWLIATVGAVTTMLGAVLALRADDLKQILAYATVSVLGTLTMLLGIGTEGTVQAALALLVAHALYKCGLFMVAGAIDHSVHQRDIRQLGGLRAAMPVTLSATVLCGLSMVGVLPLFGFVSKELYYESLGHAASLSESLSVVAPVPGSLWVGIFLTVAVTSNVLLFAAASLVCIKPFFGSQTSATVNAHEGSVAMWACPLALGLVSLTFGFLPASMEDLLAAGCSTIFGRSVSMHLALWHGVNSTLLLSLFTLAAGMVLYAQRHRVLHALLGLDALSKYGPAGCYQGLLKAANAVARWQTAVLQNGYLSNYLLMMIAATVISVWLALSGESLSRLSVFVWQVRLHEGLLISLILAAAVTAVRAKTWLLAVGSLGLVGYGVAGLFVLFGAPDLAMTQFVVETLTVILFVMAFSRLPDFRRMSSSRIRWRDAIVAMAAGGTITVLLLFAMTVRSGHPISTYYAEHSVDDAHGRNLVNVILVDFRALDTLGEITVLSIAAIGVYSLLTLHASGKTTKPPTPEQEGS